MSPRDMQSAWAEETLDDSFLGSGEELDLLGEILDSLSVETRSGGQPRASQSLGCCPQGASESCFSLVRISPAPSTYQPLLHLTSTTPPNPASSSLTSQQGHHGSWRRRIAPQKLSSGPCLGTCHLCGTPHLWRM